MQERHRCSFWLQDQLGGSNGLKNSSARWWRRKYVGAVIEIRQVERCSGAAARLDMRCLGVL
jgi:hypothetical protein